MSLKTAMEYPHISSYIPKIIPMFNGEAVADCFLGGRGVGRLQGIDGVEDDFPFGSCLEFMLNSLVSNSADFNEF